MDGRRIDACGNPLLERSLLPDTVPGAWASALAWTACDAHEIQADLHIDQRTLVMLDSGVTRMECRWGLRGLSFDLKPGSIGYFAPGCHLQASRWRWAAARRITVDLGAVSGLDPGLALALRQAPTASDIEFHDPELAALMRGLAREAAQGSPHGQLFTESLLLGLTLRLQRRDSGLHGQRDRGRLGPAQLRQLEDFVQGHLAQRMGVALLARCVGFSASQFVRLLKNTLGQTPHQYVLERRLQRAQTLVMHSELPLVLVAQETGFASQSHLTSAFARRYGEPPGVLRRRVARQAPWPDQPSADGA